MEFHATTLPGVFKIVRKPHGDERGFLARAYCEREFGEKGLITHWPQCNLTWTKRRGMLRGLHYQAPPLEEAKLISCLTGRIWDVIVDVRPDSPGFRKWEAFELDGEEDAQLYVPGGYAHGFQCLTDDVRMFYQMSEFFAASYQRGIRWDDPSLAIPWPISEPEVSEKDRSLPYLEAGPTTTLR